MRKRVELRTTPMFQASCCGGEEEQVGEERGWSVMFGIHPS